MASISGATSSNMTSSLYNSANVISGLASGLDTEGMIENLVKSYQTKISSLNQQATKTEWKQEAYRSIISKLVGFTQKYTSYNSPATNLLSPSFFSNAVKVATQGLYKDKVTASGKTSSDIALNAVHQLATAAQYRVGDSRLNSGDGKSIEASAGLDLNGKTTLGTLSGSMTVMYGSQKLNITFDEVADIKAMEEIKANLEKDGKSATDADVLAGLINQKLEGQKITFSNGQSEDAQDRVKAVVKDGSIVFEDQKASAGNTIYISQASGNVAKTLGLETDKLTEENGIDRFKLDYDFSLTRQENTAEYLSGKTMNLTLDGSTKQISLPEITGSESEGYKIKDADGNELDYTADNYVKVLNESLNKVFKGKVTASNVLGEGADDLQLRLDVQEGSDLLVNTDVGEALGIGRSATTYLNTSKTLEDLLGKNDDGTLKGLTPTKDKDGNDVYELKINDVVVGQYSKDTKLSTILNDINSNKDAGVKVSYSQTTKEFLFSAKETGADSEIKIEGGLAEAMFGSTTPEDLSGTSFAELYGASWLREGETVRITANLVGSSQLTFSLTKEMTVQDVVDTLNKSPAGMNTAFSFNKYTGQIEGRDKKSDALRELEMLDPWNDAMSVDESKVPKVDYTAGQDAKFTATINGKTMEMTRSSNSVNIDGLTINMNAVFDSTKDEDGNTITDPAQIQKNVVTFKSTTDSDKIVDVVKSMIEDYNAMLSEIRTAYSTLPAQKTDGSSYEPLTSDEASNYSESEQQRYEEKAKQGLLFADRDLSTLYDKLRGVFSPSGQDGAILRGIGINTSYDVGTGALTITLDEDKLRSMLDSDPDLVAEAFTKTSGNGGVMQNMKTTLDAYAKTSGEPKGILIQKAGSPLSPLSLMSNTWQKQIDNYNKQIEKWQDKLSSQVDRYTQQFSRLEQLIAQMNSQSSSLMGMLGG